MTPSHFGAAHHLAAAVHHVTQNATSTGSTTSLPSTPSLPTSTTTGSSTTTTTAGYAHGTGTGTSNSALSTALQTLRKDIQSIELNSGTSIGELTAIRVAFQTLKSDGLTPSSYSALQSFENSLVTTNASAPPKSITSGGSNYNTLLSQFLALYISSPTAQQTDLTNAYNALAAAVTSANISTDNINTINTDWSAVLAAENSASTATFPYFSLVTGQGSGVGHGGCG